MLTPRKWAILCTVLLLLTVLTGWILWENKALEQNAYTLNSADLPDSFSGFRVAHVSDLHNTEIGKNNRKLLSMLQELEPDLITITGDLIDSRNTDISIALEFAEEAVKIAPCYYVTGNHEARIEEYPQLREGLAELGVVVLENNAAILTREGQSISILGTADPSFAANYLFGDSEAVMDTALKQLTQNAAPFTLLLSHRPELFDVYCKNNIDLVLSGHAHGGQFRLPFIGGLYAPNQGFFPEYDTGIFTKGNTSMIVSRGIGNSLIPFRFNNRPEIILITLQSNPT